MTLERPVLDENINFGHFRPFLACFWPVMAQYQFLNLLMSTFDLVLTGLSEIGKKNPNNSDLCDDNAHLGHFRSFLACYNPGINVHSSQ